MKFIYLLGIFLAVLSVSYSQCGEGETTIVGMCVTNSEFDLIMD